MGGRSMKYSSVNCKMRCRFHLGRAFTTCWSTCILFIHFIEILWSFSVFYSCIYFLRYIWTQARISSCVCVEPCFLSSVNLGHSGVCVRVYMRACVCVRKCAISAFPRPWVGMLSVNWTGNQEHITSQKTLQMKLYLLYGVRNSQVPSREIVLRC